MKTNSIIPVGVDSLQDFDLDSLSPEQAKTLEEDLFSYLIQKARIDIDTFISLHFRKPPHPMHSEFQRIAEENQKFLLAAMRGSGKSTQITVLRTLWKLGRNPGLRAKIICARQGKAKEYVSEIGKHIKDCPQGVCQLVFPDLKPDPNRSWSAEEINVIRPSTEFDTRDGSLEAWGINSSPEGSRSDLLVFDDICTLENSVNKPKERERIKRAFVGTWMDLKAGPDETEFWYMTTLWHPDDCSHEVIRNSSWEHFIFSISEDFDYIQTNKETTFPLPYPASRGEWDRRALIEEYKDRGKFLFDRSFRNKTISEDDLLFSQDMLYGKGDDPGIIRYGISPKNKVFRKGFKYYTGVDLAIGTGRKNAQTVIFTIAVSDGSNEDYEKGLRVPVDIQVGKWSSPETARRIIETYRTWRPDVIKVENNTYQQALIEWIEELEGISIPIKPHVTGAQKLSIDEGLPLLAMEFERRNWLIPLEDRHPTECPCNYCKWIKQLLNYTPGSSENTDIVMANWFAQRAARDLEDIGVYYGRWKY